MKNDVLNSKFNNSDKEFVFSLLKSKFTLLLMTAFFMLSALFHSSCKKKDDPIEEEDIVVNDNQYTIDQTLSEGAQKNTIAFDAVAFMTGNIGSQSFLPPGKVADYSGFQYLRDNDPTGLGHNTSFVTIIAFNIMHILDTDQLDLFIVAAEDQVELINEYAYKRFPLIKAFRRLIEGDLPSGTTGLDMDAVMAYSAELYAIDGEISYNRAKLFGDVINSFSSDQLAQIEVLKGLNGVGNWNDALFNPLEGLGLDQDISVGVMTYASEMYAWYAGSVTADVYFCPERQGTYFGSFYLKDWPAMGNPNYTINEQLTASAGQDFLSVLTTTQSDLITGLVDIQYDALLELVDRREDISVELRKFLSSQSADETSVLSLSERYGELDGEIIYHYATNFAEVYQSLSDEQKTELEILTDDLGYIHPDGAFLYSRPIEMPEIINTDFLFK
jgi:hypothetical protein